VYTFLGTLLMQWRVYVFIYIFLFTKMTYFHFRETECYNFWFSFLLTGSSYILLKLKLNNTIFLFAKAYYYCLLLIIHLRKLQISCMMRHVNISSKLLYCLTELILIWMGLYVQITVVVPHSSSLMELFSWSFVRVALQRIIPLTEDHKMAEPQLIVFSE
jgi:hypothetical protein